MLKALAIAVLGTTLAGAAAAAPSTHTFRGYAYDLASGAFLYTEVHRQVIEGDRWIGGTIDYYAPDGARMGHKTLDFSKDPYVPVYRLDLAAAGGYMEGIAAVEADRIRMQKEGYGSDTVRAASVPRRGALVADSGFHSFLRDRFPEIHAPAKEDICYATTNRQAAVKAIAPRAQLMVVVGAPNSSNSLRLVEMAQRAGCPRAMMVQRGRDLDPALAERGVWFGDLDRGIAERPELVEPYLHALVPTDRSKFTALHAAFRSAGTLIHVPDGVEVELPLQAMTWIDAEDTAVFPRTLLVVGENAEVTFIDRYGSPPMKRAATAALVANRLRSHSHGPGWTSSKSLIAKTRLRSAEA